jgi:two-component sensor histidine kinase
LAPACDTRLLLREFTHRINNDFTSAIIIVSLAAARSRSGEVKAALSAVQDRLQSYASVHRALQMPEHTTP